MSDIVYDDMIEDDPSDTPRTDAQVDRAQFDARQWYDFARQLERELNAARNDIALASGELCIPMPSPGTDMARVMVANAIMRGERDEVRNQLARICQEGFDNQDTIGGELADDYVLRMLAEQRKPCDWKEDEDGNWDTQCGQCMCFEHGPPNDQGYKFCHHCGHPINFVEFAQPLDEPPGPA